jgi:uncharacterized membrane protein SpoIIM required for sporulation
MRETKFIQQNEEKWREFESVMENPRKDPDKLNDLFVQITDDLSYSRTFYPNRSVRVYLNSLAQRIFIKLYKNRRSNSNRLFSFWTDELPQLVYESRSAFRLSFFVFVLACLIGGVSSAMDEEFAAVILGDSYVEMTLENIDSGDPMAVYKQKGALGMSLGITVNNLWVAFLTFVMGAFFTVGSIAILIRNGIMLGAFQYFFIEQGLFWESFLTIWIHGTLEISAIIIAGAAGITMGRGLVFPGTYSRVQSFQRSARRGIKLMVGIAPIIIMAGFIEGYLTRYTGTPNILRGAFIGVCLLFVLIYFVWYPWFRARVGFSDTLRETKIPPSRSRDISFGYIKSSGEIFAEIFVLYRKHLSKIVLVTLIATTLFTLLVFIPGDGALSSRFVYPYSIWEMIRAKGQFFVNEAVPLFWLSNAAVYGLILLVIFRFVIQEEQPDLKWDRRQWILNAVNVFIPMVVLQLIIHTSSWYTPYIMLLVLPTICVWSYVSVKERQFLPQALGRALLLIREGISTTLGLFAILLILGFLFTMLTDTALAGIFIDLITWVVYMEEPNMSTFSTVVLTFASAFLLHLVLAMIFFGGALLYHSLLESREAIVLKEDIAQIGISHQIKGIEKE